MKNKNLLRRLVMQLPLFGIALLHMSCHKVDSSSNSGSNQASATKTELNVAKLQTGLTAIETIGTEGTATHSTTGSVAGDQILQSLKTKFEATPQCTIGGVQTSATAHEYYSFSGADCPVQGFLKASDDAANVKKIEMVVIVNDTDLQKSLNLQSIKITGFARSEMNNQITTNTRYVHGDFKLNATENIHAVFHTEEAAGDINQSVTLTSGTETLNYQLKKKKGNTAVITKNLRAATYKNYVAELKNFGTLYSEFFEEAVED